MQTENELTIQVAEYLDILKSQGKVVLFTHVANELRTTPWAGAKRKRMGLRKGFPDFVIVYQNSVLFLELKREKGGSISSDQKTWIKALNELYSVEVKAYVAKGWDEAKHLIDLHIHNELPIDID